MTWICGRLKGQHLSSVASFRLIIWMSADNRWPVAEMRAHWRCWLNNNKTVFHKNNFWRKSPGCRAEELSWCVSLPLRCSSLAAESWRSLGENKLNRQTVGRFHLVYYAAEQYMASQLFRASKINTIIFFALSITTRNAGRGAIPHRWCLHPSVTSAPVSRARRIHPKQGKQLSITLCLSPPPLIFLP